MTRTLAAPILQPFSSIDGLEMFGEVVELSDRARLHYLEAKTHCKHFLQPYKVCDIAMLHAHAYHVPSMCNE